MPISAVGDSAGDGATGTLAAFTVEATTADLPDHVRERALHLLIDTVGCGLAGAPTEMGIASTRWVDSLATPPVSTVLGSGVRAMPAFAACANARMVGTLDADEILPCDRQVSHHGAATLAVALALGEQEGLSGRELLTTFAVGYEVGARVSMAMVPPERGAGLRGGWGPGGTVASALTAARVLGLDGGLAAHAVGLAGMHIDGPTLQWAEMERAPMIKSADGGWHAMTGVLCAQMAAHGITGYDRILDGPNGLWRVLGYASCDEEALLGDLGGDWRLLHASFKWWPCQYWMQQALTAFARVRQDHDLGPDDIAQVTIRTNSRSFGRRFHEQSPHGEVERSFSFPHAIAMMLLDVAPGPRWTDDDLADDPVVVALRQRVTVELHPDAGDYRAHLTDSIVRRMPAGVLVHTTGGDTLDLDVVHAMGNPWDDTTRPSLDDLLAKFRVMTERVGRGPGWSRQVDELVDLLVHLDDVGNVADLAALLVPRD